MDPISEYLINKGIKPTAIRILVYRCLNLATGPLSLSDIELKLVSVDKSTISRTLSIFKRHNVIHAFNDGSGSVKYELIRNDNGDKEGEYHVHFRCEKCGKTECLSSINIPEVELPEGYKVKDITYMVTGTCKECSRY